MKIKKPVNEDRQKVTLVASSDMGVFIGVYAHCFGKKYLFSKNKGGDFFIHLKKGRRLFSEKRAAKTFWTEKGG